MANEIIQQIDLGVRIFGIDQCEYAVDGKRDKTLGQAVGLASIARAVAIEEGISGYTALINRRRMKIDSLKEGLAVCAGTRANWDALTGTDGASYTSSKLDMVFTEEIGGPGDFKTLLDTYGISTGEWDLSNQITAAELDKIKAAIDYEVQETDNDLQGDMASLQNYITKRDNAYSTATKFQKKCDDSISAQMKYINGS